MRNYFLCLITIVYLLSCKSMLINKFHFNRVFRFESKTAYLQFVRQHYGADSTQLITLKGEGRAIFLTDIGKHNIADYYGCFINDSTSVKKSAYLLNDAGCLGKITHEIEAIATRENWNDTALFQQEYLKDLNLRYCYSNEPFQPNANTKCKILLALHYSMGTYYDGHIREILNYVKLHSDKMAAYIILFDEIFEVPLNQ